MSWVTTASVLEKLRDFDNREVWDFFAERFRRPIVSFARGMGLRQADAEDAAQETLLAFAQAYRTGKYDASKGRLSRFLFGIAYRQALQARPAGAVGQVESGFWSQVPDEQAASGVWDVEWERAILDQCIQQARMEFGTEKYRAFEMVVREGLPAAEVAQSLGLAVGTVYNAKYHIVKRIRELRSDYA
jgi:RNA polymerase sigma-70 factor (ECF subfamily)